MQQQADPIAPPFSTGQVISFEYPKSNQVHNRRPHYRRRTIAVTEVRDMSRHGVTLQAIKTRPTLARGRWLVTGTCLETGQERSFYVESMKEKQQQTWLTLGLFDPLAESGPVYTDGLYAPTAADRQFLCQVLDRFNLLDAEQPPVPDTDDNLILGVFPINDDRELNG